MSRDINVVRIKAVANILRKLNKEIVFVGGATVALYADKQSAEARPTDDVDVLVELSTRYAYAALEQELREAGFVHDQDSGVICRFRIQGIIVDIMPTESTILGFANQWYPEGFKTAVPVQLDELVINVFSVPYFIASKLEAHKDRGGDDLRFSTDFEDIIYVLENRKSVLDELLAADKEVKKYLVACFAELLNHRDIDEGIFAHLEHSTAVPESQRIKTIFDEIIKSDRFV